MSSRKNKSKHEALRGVLIIELIVCYMALLNIVSHAMGPQKFEAATDKPLLTASDFVSFQGETVHGQSLRLENPTSGEVSGYSAQLSLKGLKRVYIHFQIDCPTEQVGAGLCVDLYDQESGYDNEEQEYRLFLQEGMNEVSSVLEIGETAPEKAELRFFTGDITDYVINDLQIYRDVPLAKVTPAMIYVFVGSIFVLVATAFVYCRLLRKDS